MPSETASGAPRYEVLKEVLYVLVKGFPDTPAGLRFWEWGWLPPSPFSSWALPRLRSSKKTRCEEDWEGKVSLLEAVILDLEELLREVGCFSLVAAHPVGILLIGGSLSSTRFEKNGFAMEMREKA